MTDILLNSFTEAGMTSAQAKKIINHFKQIYKVPLERIDITERLNRFYDVFKKFGKSPEEINTRLANCPSLLTNLPEQIEQKILNSAFYFAKSPQKWLDMVWTNPVLFVRNGEVIDQIISEQARLLEKDKEKWLKKAFQKPAVLSITTKLITNNLKINAEQFGLSLLEWKDIAAKEPELLYANPKMLLQKIQENAITFQTDMPTLCRSFKKAPSLFYMDPKQTRKKVTFLTQMYLNDLFQLDDNGVKEPLILRNYLLQNPLYIKSLSSIHRRCTYARYLKYRNEKAGKAPVWQTNKKIEETLAQAPASFFQQERPLKPIHLQKYHKQRT